MSTITSTISNNSLRGYRKKRNKIVPKNAKMIRGVHYINTVICALLPRSLDLCSSKKYKSHIVISMINFFWGKSLEECAESKQYMIREEIKLIMLLRFSIEVDIALVNDEHCERLPQQTSNPSTYPFISSHSKDMMLLCASVRACASYATKLLNWTGKEKLIK